MFDFLTIDGMMLEDKFLPCKMMGLFGGKGGLNLQAGEPEIYTVERLILEALAEVRLAKFEILKEEMRGNNGDLDITAKEEAAVVALLEDKLKSGPLLEPQDFDKKRKQANSCLSPIDGITVKELRDIILQKIKSIK